MKLPYLDVGTIEKIVLRNFMCHEYLQVDFDSNLNIVIGSNGSGKSAILTAMVLVLGGKASNTNRASNMRDLIKTGCSFATIEITLRNSGVDSYKCEVFGERIVIEKRLLPNSAAKYKIKSSDQRVVSTARDDLEMIVDHFNVQVCNPVCVLTQETSRKFLSSSNPKAKYTIFLNATSLSQMKSRIVSTIEKQCDSEKALLLKIEACEQYRKYVNDLRAKLEIHSQMDTIAQRINYLKHQLKWAAYNVDYKEYEKHARQNRSLEKLYSRYQINVSDTNEEINTKNTILKDIAKEVRKLGSETTTLLKDKERVNRKYNDIETTIITKKNRIQYLTNELRQVDKLYEELALKIDTLKKKDEKSRELERQAVAEKHQQLLSKSNQLEVSRKDLDQQHRTLSKSVFTKKQTQLELSTDKRNIFNNIHKKEQQFDRLAKSNSHLTVYSRDTPALLNDIQVAFSKGLFERKPLGPIGSLISLDDNRWALSVESALKKLLFSYCVHSHKDKTTLIKLARRYYSSLQLMPNFIVMKFENQVYNISQDKLPKVSSYPTMLNLIHSSHPTIINLLIDHASIEKILCIENIEHAKQLMLRQPPKNIIKAFTIAGDEFLINFQMNTSRFYSNPHSAPRFIVEDMNNQKKELERQINEDRLSLELTENRLRQTNNEIKENQSEMSSISQQLEAIKREQYTLKNEIGELEEEIKKEKHALNLDDLESELAEMSDKKDHMLQNINLYNEESGCLSDQLVVLRDELSKFTSEHERIKLLFDSKKGEEDVVSGEIRGLQIKLDSLKNTMSTCKNQLDQSLIRSNALLATLQEREVQLSIEGESTDDSKRPPKDIDKEIGELNTKLQHSRQINPEDTEQLISEYTKENKRLVDCSKTIENLQQFTETLKNQLVARKRKYEVMQSTLTTKLKKYFSSILGYRGFDGSLNFDHAKEELVINMSLRNDSINIKDVKSLSGGERSFSTLAFVVSLWMTMDTPFRCLDEFDVFMDSINRKICFDLLIDYSKQNSANQLVIFTPQDISDIKNEDMLTILRLSPPIR